MIYLISSCYLEQITHYQHSGLQINSALVQEIENLLIRTICKYIIKIPIKEVKIFRFKIRTIN